MEISGLNRRELIDKLTAVYQLSRRYDQAYRDLYIIQQKKLPPEEAKIIPKLQGRFGGGGGVIIFLALFFLCGFKMQVILEAILISLKCGSALVRFLVTIALTAAVMALLTVPVKNAVNFVIGEINRKREARAGEKNEKIAEHNRQVQQEMTPYLEKMQAVKRQYRAVGVAIPQRYSTTAIIKRLLELLEDGRADSWAGAVNLYEEEMSRRRMENHMRSIQESREQQYNELMNMQDQMLANQQMTNLLVTWNLANTLMRS